MNSVKILITSVVSIAIQFGLAIAGWGGWSAFFAHPALRALAWVTVGLVALAIPSGGGLSTGVKEDRGNRWVLGATETICRACRDRGARLLTAPPLRSCSLPPWSCRNTCFQGSDTRCWRCLARPDPHLRPVFGSTGWS